MALYEKFGEFDSASEINHKAEQLFNAGDLDGLRNMACENGIPDDFVEMYIDGEIPELCDDQMAAVGKIDMEMDELQLSENSRILRSRWRGESFLTSSCR